MYVCMYVCVQIAASYPRGIISSDSTKIDGLLTQVGLIRQRIHAGSDFPSFESKYSKFDQGNTARHDLDSGQGPGASEL